MRKFLNPLLGLLLAVLTLSGCGGGGNDPFEDYPPYYDNGGLYVPPPNNNPSQLLAYYDSYDTFADSILFVDDFDGVLANDIYLTGEAYADFPLSSVQGGDIEGYSDGSFEYEPPVGFVGDDSFTYTLVGLDGRTSSAQVFLHVYPLENARRIRKAR